MCCLFCFAFNGRLISYIGIFHWRNFYNLAAVNKKMENVKETYKKSNASDNANNPAHYRLLTLGIIIIMIGCLLRFMGEWAMIDMVSNLITIVGIGISLKSVYNILQ